MHEHVLVMHERMNRVQNTLRSTETLLREINSSTQQKLTVLSNMSEEGNALMLAASEDGRQHDPT